MARKTLIELRCDDCGKLLQEAPLERRMYVEWRLGDPRSGAAAHVGNGLDLCRACHDERLLHSFALIPLRPRCLLCGGDGMIQESQGCPSPDCRAVTCNRCHGRGVQPLMEPKTP